MSRLVSNLLAVGAVVCGILLISKLMESATAAPRQAREILAAAVRRLLASACDTLGVPCPPLRFTDEVANAASDGVEILVNLTWFGDALQRHCDDHVCAQNVLLGVMAHELGHHLAQHARNGFPRHEAELEADRVAGFVLARSGGTPVHLESLLVELSPMWTETHPGSTARIAAVREGFQQGCC